MRVSAALAGATGLVLAVAGGGPLLAQEAGGGEAAAEAVASDTAQGLWREVFSYPAAGRRDPFAPLSAGDELGPRFEDLELSGILYSPSTGSIAVLVDRSTRRRYRVWEGDAIGEARLIEIRPDEAVFTVTVFGVSRQETLRVKRDEKEQGR